MPRPLLASWAAAALIVAYRNPRGSRPPADLHELIRQVRAVAEPVDKLFRAVLPSFEQPPARRPRNLRRRRREG